MLREGCSARGGRWAAGNALAVVSFQSAPELNYKLLKKGESSSSEHTSCPQKHAAYSIYSNFPKLTWMYFTEKRKAYF